MTLLLAASCATTGGSGGARNAKDTTEVTAEDEKEGRPGSMSCEGTIEKYGGSARGNVPDSFKKELHAEVRQLRSALSRCYEKGMKAAGGALNGKVYFHLVVGTTGDVLSAKPCNSDLGSEPMLDCMEEHLSSVERVETESRSQVLYPFIFTPKDSSE
jgi:hypothetical protein